MIWESLQPGHLRSPCRPRWVWHQANQNIASGRRNQPAAGVAFGSGDGGRNTSDKSPRGSRKAVNLCTWLVCATIMW